MLLGSTFVKLLQLRENHNKINQGRVKIYFVQLFYFSFHMFYVMYLHSFQHNIMRWDLLPKSFKNMFYGSIDYINNYV